MNGNEILRLVDALHRDKNIEKEIVFEGIEQAIISAARKVFGEESEIEVQINREDGRVAASVDNEPLNADEIGDLLGRIAAQTAKQVMIQKIREAERDSLYDEYSALKSQIVTGTVTRVDGGACTVNLGKTESILPRGEQIPGEYHRVGERLRAVILDVRKAGSRVKIILSRTHPDLVRRLFEVEIPEVAEHVIEVRSLSREAGYRSKVAVSCIDSKIDAVGACVGVRGARIKSIVDELAGERIDIVRWNDSLQVLVPNSLQPAEVEDVILCPMLGKVIVLVRDDQLSLAIGKKGQNVRLASKLVGWDIHVMTQAQLDEQLDESVAAFSAIPGVSDDLAEALVAQGFFSFDDLSVIEPDQLAELGGLTPEQCDTIIAHADRESARIEQEELRAKAEERRTRELEAAIAGAGGSIEEQPAEEPSAQQVTPDQQGAPAGETEAADEQAEAAPTATDAQQPAATAAESPEPAPEAGTPTAERADETSPQPDVETQQASGAEEEEEIKQGAAGQPAAPPEAELQAGVEGSVPVQSADAEPSGPAAEPDKAEAEQAVQTGDDEAHHRGGPDGRGEHKPEERKPLSTAEASAKQD